MLLTNNMHANYVASLPKTNQVVKSPETNGARRVSTRCNRWLCPWSGRYLAVLCCHVEAVSGRVTGSVHWVTMMARSFRGFYETGKGCGGRVKTCSLKSVPIGSGPIGNFLRTKDMRWTYREWDVLKAIVERRGAGSTYRILMQNYQ